MSPRLPTGPEPTAVDVEYIATDQLQPVEDASEALQVRGTRRMDLTLYLNQPQRVLQDLTASDWFAACQNLTLLRQLCAHHSELVQPHMCEPTAVACRSAARHVSSHRPTIMPVLHKLVQNPRSTLCKVRYQ